MKLKTEYLEYTTATLKSDYRSGNRRLDSNTSFTVTIKITQKQGWKKQGF